MTSRYCRRAESLFTRLIFRACAQQRAGTATQLDTTNPSSCCSVLQLASTCLSVKEALDLWNAAARQASRDTPGTSARICDQDGVAICASASYDPSQYATSRPPQVTPSANAASGAAPPPPLARPDLRIPRLLVCRAHALLQGLSTAPASNQVAGSRSSQSVAGPAKGSASATVRSAMLTCRLAQGVGRSASSASGASERSTERAIGGVGA